MANYGELVRFRAGIATDTISEQTSGSGVTIDSVVLKDSAVTAASGVTTPTISEAVSGSGVSIDGVTLKDSAVTAASGVTTPTISEAVSGSGVSIDGVTLKDSAVTAASGISFGNEFLANYDEGTWSPTLSVTGDTGNFAATTQHASYTRIGNKIWFQIEIQCTQSSTATGQIQFTLPANNSRTCSGWGWESSNTAKALGVLIETTTCQFRFADATSTTGSASTRYYYVSGIYTPS